MARIILYIASSLDGYIARPNGSVDWLMSIAQPTSGDDYGYTALMNHIGTAIMGRKTYEALLGMSEEWPYHGLNVYVVSQDPALPIRSPNTTLLNSNWAAEVIKLKETSEKEIWLIGGGTLITAFLNQTLLDKMIITIIPKIIGEGIPLFAPKSNESSWILSNATAYDTGVVTLTYEKA